MVKRTKQDEQFNSDLIRLGLLASGEKAHSGPTVRVGGRDFYWVEVGCMEESSIIQADYYDKHFEPKRRHIMEIDETGEVLHVYASDLPSFKVAQEKWQDLLKAIGFSMTMRAETLSAFWLYWTPAGDEMMVGHPTHPGYGEFDGDWSAWLKLRELNPKVFNNPTSLGSSEEDGTHVLLFQKRDADWDPPIVYLAEKKFLDLYYLRGG